MYCFTTIRVAAGAVAVAIAPRVIAAGSGNRSGMAKWTAQRAMSTKTVAASAWKTAMVTTFLPMCLRSSSLNSLPIAKAMNPSAASEMML